jgi:DNA-directed RNA polymerase specialized sigma24 family protein
MIMTMENSCDEAGLLASARRGSLDAFNQLVLEHQDAAWNLAFHLLWNEATAGTVVQNAVRDIHRELWLLGRGSFRLHLLYRVVRACERILKNEPKSLQPDTLKYGEGTAAVQLSALPLPERIVLVLAEVEGLSCPEIAEVTGAPVPLVRVRMGKALAACALAS